MRQTKWSTYVIALVLALFLGACEGEKEEPVNVAPAATKSGEAMQAQGDEAIVAPASAPVSEPGDVVAVEPAATMPPEILSLKLEPTLVFPGTVVKFDAEAKDPQDRLVTFDFIWEVNGEPLSDQVLDELDTADLQKGDVITVLVTPVSENVKGESKRSRPVVILNRPPEITSAPMPAVEEGVFTYPVTAIDPDGDKLNFALENAPTGMKIDADSGLIDWVVPAGYDGKVQVRIAVSDGDARAFQNFDMTVTNK